MLVHEQSYIDQVKNSDEENLYLSASTAAGGAIEAVKIVCENQVDSAFAIVRPPGHHAHCVCHNNDGFCFFNNIAIATVVA